MMNSMKHLIVLVFLTAIMLSVLEITSVYSEINSGISWISEIPSPQQFFKLS